MKVPGTDGDARVWWWALIGAWGFGVTGHALYAFAASDEKTGALILIGSGVLVAIAFFFFGAFVGFILGVPRVNTNGGGGDTAQPRYGENTTLEQFSDWITKILVGVGLTQLSELPGLINNLGVYLGGAVGNGGSGPVVGMALGSAYFLLGFFAAYVGSRLFLPGALGRARAEVISLDAIATINAAAFDTHQDGPPQLPEAAKEAAATVAKLPLEKIQTAEQAIAWVRAHVDIGEFEAANAGMQKLALLDPSSEQTRSAELTELRLRITEGAMYAAVYAPAPEGFKKAQDLGEQQLARNELTSGDVWCLLGLAYAQQHRWDKEHNSTPELLAQSRSKAFNALKNGLKQDSSWLPRLRMAWDPNFPNKAKSEDDLEVFFGDPDFEGLLGPPTPSTAATPAGPNAIPKP